MIVAKNKFAWLLDIWPPNSTTHALGEIPAELGEACMFGVAVASLWKINLRLNPSSKPVFKVPE